MPNDRYKHVESLLAVSLVLLKFNVLYHTWGKIQGYDWFSWIEMFHVVHWFEPLPPALIWGASYHPPLSFLTARLIFPFYPHEYEVSQVNASLSILVAFFSLRYALRRIGWLHTLPGLWVLYGGISIPVIVSLGVESTYDGWVLAWFMLAFAMSIALFWNEETPLYWWKNKKFARGVTALGLIYAAGQLNKFNGLLAFALPFLIITIRRGIRTATRESSAPIVAALISLTIVFPLYHERYYVPTGRWMPTAMDWQQRRELVSLRAQRDAAPLAFVANMIRYPLVTPKDPQEPVLDSFIHLSWLQTWIKDGHFGKQPEPSLTVSRLYSRVFGTITLAGTALFFVRRRKIPLEWRQMGWLLFIIMAGYSAFAIAFGWKYPIWGWRVFKTKYMTPVVFWIPYAVAVVYSDPCFESHRSGVLRWVENLGFYALITFVLINHLLPVYIEL